MNMTKYLGTFLIAIFVSLSIGYAQSKTVTGYVQETKSGEALVGVTIQLSGTQQGTVSNDYGYFSLVVKDQPIKLVFHRVGYEPLVYAVASTSHQLLVELTPQAIQLNEVTVAASSVSNTSLDGGMSTVLLPIRQLKQLPMVLGEKDVIKALQLLPGVQKGREGTTGLYVRGGGPDQNLLLLDGATVYNANHLFGFFSVFNGDALRHVELTKGSFPARFGGRLSSVVEMQMKEGSRSEWHAEGGIGLLSSRLTIEGPVKRNKSSFMVSARRSYADLLAQPLTAGGFPKIYFYDLNAKVNVDIGERNKLFISGYLGQDFFRFTSKLAGTSLNDGFNWGSATTTVRWNTLVSDKLFINSSLLFSQYKFLVYNQQKTLDGDYFLEYRSNIRDFGIKTDIDYKPNNAHEIRLGTLLTRHQFEPNAIVRKDRLSELPNEERTLTDALETGSYLEDRWRVTSALYIHSGLRLSSFYVDTKQYVNLEPRLSAGYQLSRHLVLNASYSQMNQYVHLLSNSGLGLPTDLWVPATERIPPQQANQVAMGIAKDGLKQGLTLSAEAYYKTMSHLIGYREGASFLLLDSGPNAHQVSAVNWQDNVTVGSGRSYGIELLAQRKTGRLSGWVGYTLSWVHHRFADLNNGQEFFPRYDRRHDLSVVALYQFKPQLTFSSTFVYGTGNALTLPIAQSNLGEHSFTNFSGPVPVDQYGVMNSFRAAPYHRLDLAIQFRKVKRWGERQWEISVYNVYNRVNPFYYETRRVVTTNSITAHLYRRGLFPIIPSVSYSFKF